MESPHPEQPGTPLPVEKQTLRELQEVVEFLDPLPEEAQGRVGEMVVRLRLRDAGSFLGKPPPSSRQLQPVAK